jgi:hypothetical protein
MLANIGEDDNAALAAHPWAKVISKAVTVEGEVTLLVNLIAAARFEFLQNESESAFFQRNNSRRYIATIGYTPLENFKVSTEFKYEIGQTDINRIGTLGATFSF